MNRSRMLQSFLSQPFSTYPTDGLVSYWRLDEDPAIHNTVIEDSIGSNNGTLITNDGSTNKSVVGKVDKAISLDGVDDHVIIPHSESINITGEITLCAWVNFQSLTNFNYIMGKRNSTARTYSLLRNIDTNKYVFLINSTSGQVIISSQTSIPTDEWVHVVGSWNGNTMRLYINGTEESSSSQGGSIITNNSSLRLGWDGDRQSSGYMLHGYLDDVLIYNKGLTASEIQQIYNFGA